MAYKGDDGGGLEALHHLKSTDPPLFITPSSELSLPSRTASQYLFSSLKPHAPKSPFDQLHTDGFDTEQIWQQIDLQNQPLDSSLRREIKRFTKEPARISGGIDAIVGKVGSRLESVEVEDMERDDDSESDEFEEDGNDEDEEDVNDEDESDNDDMKENEMEEESEDYGSGEELEDKFLKIKELEKYLKEDEAREYGLKTKPKKSGGKKASKDDDETEVGEDDDEDEDDQLGLFEEGDEDDELESARYEDFFVSNKKKPEKKRKQIDRSDDWNTRDEQEDNEIDGSEDSDAEDLQVDNENDESDDSDAEDDQEDSQKKEGKLSKHEIEQKKLQAKIKEMEKANLDTKTWTMQGEVTAAKRPLNSALEVDLDFEHNDRPAPVITEEVTASIEEILKKRIIEGRFDGAQRAPKLASKAPREVKELDENKSKRGLADLYEEEYMEKTGLAPASLSFSDELKKEANLLFKRLTFKLNALSHFHFAPKPVVEDMTIETNLPALAMEEVAPVAVSDAAMLAPEEVFAGKGDVKEETELTQEDRKRRRAKKKRKFKAEQSKRMAKKVKQTPVITQGEGKVTVVKA